MRIEIDTGVRQRARQVGDSSSGVVDAESGRPVRGVVWCEQRLGVGESRNIAARFAPRYLALMRTRMTTKGQIRIPAALRERDNIRPGQEFDIQRLKSGQYLLLPHTARVNHGLVDLLLECPVKGYFVPIESESAEMLVPASSIHSGRSHGASRHTQMELK